MIKFYIVCCCVLVVLVFTTINIRKESTSFYGLADTKEMTISAETAVEIKKIRIMPGQSVKQGDTIVELNSQALDLRINDISHQLDELNTRVSAHVKMTYAEIRLLREEQEEKANELRAQIQALEAKLKSNEEDVRNLRSIPTNVKKDEKSSLVGPDVITLENLKKQLKRSQDSSQIVINSLTTKMKYEGDPLADQKGRLEEELRLLKEQKKNLFIVSQISGVIGTVHFKDGEKVSPFDSIMTVHAESPSFVSGYIHENAYSKVKVGQKVQVQSLAGTGVTITGTVTGVGSRIVEYPVRLRRMPEVQMWGREIIIQIPEKNKLILGEKVIISLLPDKKGIVFNNFFGHLLASELYAEERVIDKSRIIAESPIADITSAIKLKKPIEASGVLYLDDLKKYLVVSDETKKKAPVVYLMDSAGVVGEEARIQGLESINDMESITQDERGIIYILTSQSENKKGLLPESRRLFIRVRRTGSSLKCDGSVFLLDMLAKTAKQRPGELWATFIASGMEKRSIEIEGMFYGNGTIYLGFKKPLINDSAIILAVGGIDDLFKNNVIDPKSISLWQKFFLKDAAGGIVYKITDMCRLTGNLYIVSTASHNVSGEKKYQGMLWGYTIEQKVMTPLRHFDGIRPEGIAYNGDNKSFCVTFDNGSEHPSQMMTIRVSL